MLYEPNVHSLEMKAHEAYTQRKRMCSMGMLGKKVLSLKPTVLERSDLQQRI